MYFTLILENESGEQVNLSTTANQYMTSKIEGLNPPAGTISTSCLRRHERQLPEQRLHRKTKRSHFLCHAWHWH